MKVHLFILFLFYYKKKELYLLFNREIDNKIYLILKYMFIQKKNSNQSD